MSLLSPPPTGKPSVDDVPTAYVPEGREGFRWLREGTLVLRSQIGEVYHLAVEAGPGASLTQVAGHLLGRIDRNLLRAVEGYERADLGQHLERDAGTTVYLGPDEVSPSGASQHWLVYVLATAVADMIERGFPARALTDWLAFGVLGEAQANRPDAPAFVHARLNEIASAVSHESRRAAERCQQDAPADHRQQQPDPPPPAPVTPVNQPPLSGDTETAEVVGADVSGHASRPSNGQASAPEPTPAGHWPMFGASQDFVEEFGLEEERVDRFLRRLRAEHPDCFFELVPDQRRPREPHYVYRRRKVLPHLLPKIEEWKAQDAPLADPKVDG